MPLSYCCRRCTLEQTEVISVGNPVVFKIPLVGRQWKDSSASIVIENDIADPDLNRVIAGHKVNGACLTPSLVSKTLWAADDKNTATGAASATAAAGAPLSRQKFIAGHKVNGACLTPSVCLFPISHITVLIAN
jgi:hypothetical protein